MVALAKKYPRMRPKRAIRRYAIGEVKYDFSSLPQMVKTFLIVYSSLLCDSLFFLFFGFHCFRFRQFEEDFLERLSHRAQLGQIPTGLYDRPRQLGTYGVVFQTMD